MTPQQLQSFLHQHIPASAALAIEVQSCDAQHVTLTAPHHLNRNHKNTVFGGSMALAATLCAWSLVHLRCPEAQGNIVIQESRIRYLRPARDGLTLHTAAGDDTAWQAMQTMLTQRGKGKIVLNTKLLSHGERVAVFEGKFVAMI